MPTNDKIIPVYIAMEDSPKSEDENETTKSEDESDDFCP